MSSSPFDLKRYAALARQMAAEGAVLLENRDNTLPLAPGSRVAVFGRAQCHYYKSGTGSGGMVNTDHVTGIWEALSGPGGYQCDAAVRAVYTSWVADHPYDAGGGWAQEPWFQPETPVEEAVFARAAVQNDAAVVILGRTAGEDQDNADEPGSYRLTEAEEQLLEAVCRHFARSIVLLNVGNVIDMSWVEKYQPAAVLYVWQGGQEGGLGVLDVLTGACSPCGRLADTIARNLSDHPSSANYGDAARNVYAEDIYMGYRYFETFARDAVCYPFGAGLSYTVFERQVDWYDQAADGIVAGVTVTNTGSVPGKEVVQLYLEAPQGVLGKPARVLCAFGKTDLLAPGQSQTLRLFCPWKALASFDDSGLTGHRWAWVLEEGRYRFCLGGDIRAAREAFSLALPFRVLEQAGEALAPHTAFQRLRPGADGQPVWEDVPLGAADPDARRMAALPTCKPFTGDCGLKLWDVADGKAEMEDFLAQLSDEDLCILMRGEGMCSPRVTPGTASAFGGVSDALVGYGLPAICCSDGPSGIRMDCGTIAFSMPNGACIACSFNEALATELYAMAGLELRKNKIDTILGPGMNLHRHPLNGRNFEYFSEDPLLTGRMAVAQLAGLHRWGVTGTIKHFACNNQEFHRVDVEAVISERALRELYLRGFEIAVREGGARLIMTSYNPINGWWTASSYDLVTTILRQEWGFIGVVMTDWGAKCNDAGQLGTKQNTAAMVRAQNDLYMVVADPEHNSNQDNLEQALAQGRLTRAELVRCASNICRFILTTPAFRRLRQQSGSLDSALTCCTEPNA